MKRAKMEKRLPNTETGTSGRSIGCRWALTHLGHPRKEQALLGGQLCGSLREAGFSASAKYPPSPQAWHGSPVLSATRRQQRAPRGLGQGTDQSAHNGQEESPQVFR